MKPYTCFFAAHGCCRSANSKGNSPLSFSLSLGGHRGSGSTAVKKQPCPLPPTSPFFFLLYGTNLHGSGGTISYRMPPFSFFPLLPRLLLTTNARLAPLSRTTPPALKHSRQPPFPEMGWTCLLFPFFFFFIIIEWCRGFLRKMASVIFHSATVRRELPLIGSTCSHGNARGSISVCAQRTHTVCVSSSVLTEQGRFTFLSAVGNTKEWPQRWRSPRVYGGCMSWYWIEHGNNLSQA